MARLLPRCPRSASCLLLLAASTAAAILLVAHLPQERIGCDFLSFFTAAELITSGADPYDAALQAQMQRHHGWDTASHGRGLYEFMPYYYPPWFALALGPLVPLGYPLARIGWVALDLELLLISGFLLQRTAPGVPAWVPIVGVPAFAFSVFATLMGQTSPLLLFLIVASWRLLERGRDGLAGGMLAWLTIKPQLTAVLLGGVLLWAIRRRRYAVIRGFVLVLGLLILASLYAAPAWPVAFLEATRRTPPPTAYFPSVGATWLATLRTLNITGWRLGTLYLAAVVPLVAAMFRAAGAAQGSLRRVLAVAVVAAFFVTPYGRPYDFPILLVALSDRPAGRHRLALAIVDLLLILQVAILQTCLGDINLAVNELGVTFFWLPLALTSGWLESGLLSLHRACCPRRVPAA
jgi:hypothetical protein